MKYMIPVLLGMLYAAPSAQSPGQPASAERNGIIRTTDEKGVCYADTRQVPYFTIYCDFKLTGRGVDTVTSGIMPNYVSQNIIVADKMSGSEDIEVSRENPKNLLVRRKSEQEKTLNRTYQRVLDDFNKPEKK